MNLRDHIINTTIYLFSRNGIRRVSMDEVAHKANVSKRTLYDFFEDKEALLISVLKKIYEPLIEQMEFLEKQSETALEVILLCNEKMMEKPTWLCEDFMEDLKRYPKALQFIVEGKQSFLKRWIDLLKRGEKEAVFISGINYDLISLVVQQHFSKTVPSELFTKYSHEEVHHTVFFLFLRGICTGAGRDILDKFIIKLRYRRDFVNDGVVE